MSTSNKLEDWIVYLYIYLPVFHSLPLKGRNNQNRKTKKRKKKNTTDVNNKQPTHTRANISTLYADTRTPLVPDTKEFCYSKIANQNHITNHQERLKFYLIYNQHSWDGNIALDVTPPDHLILFVWGEVEFTRQKARVKDQNNSQMTRNGKYTTVGQHTHTHTHTHTKKKKNLKKGILHKKYCEDFYIQDYISDI